MLINHLKSLHAKCTDTPNLPTCVFIKEQIILKAPPPQSSCYKHLNSYLGKGRNTNSYLWRQKYSVFYTEMVWGVVGWGWQRQALLEVLTLPLYNCSNCRPPTVSDTSVWMYKCLFICYVLWWIFLDIIGQILCEACEWILFVSMCVSVYDLLYSYVCICFIHFFFQ